MDVLSDVLRVVRLSGAVFFTAEFTSPWAVESPSADLLASVLLPDADCLTLFHILLEGDCLVECEAHPPATMRAGDVIVFPHGESHTMRSSTGVRPTRLDYVFSPAAQDELPQVSFAGGGAKARVICGYLQCDQRFGPLFRALPTMLLVRSHDRHPAVEAIDRHGMRPRAVPHESGAWLRTTLVFAANEAAAARPGNVVMLGRLTELMFVEIIREYMHQLPSNGGGWLAALRDPFVGKALRLLHAHPKRNWTVDALSHEVALSRSALAQRFTLVLGEAPMRYLAAWRLELAKQMLRDGRDSVSAVALRVGYESEAAFNRAFKRATGVPPATWRRAEVRRASRTSVPMPRDA